MHASFRRALTAAALALSACSEPQARRPNVLLVSIDMLRPDHLSCYGYARPTSPNIDRLASEGVLYETHVSSTSWTLPAHAAMFTGLPDSIHGCTDSHLGLHPRFETLAERFGSAGYETIGIFAGPYLHPAFGIAQGFERYENCSSSASSATPGAAAEVAVHRESHADVTNPRSYKAFESWFSERSERPFFAFVHLWDVHYDFVPPPPYDRLFDPLYEGQRDGRGFVSDPSIAPTMPKRDLEHLLALYDGEIAWTDEFVGRMRTLLESAGVLDDTIVVITSDHGTEFFEHGQKGHRKTLYDEVTRIPLVVRFPRELPAGTRVARQTRMIDLAPTLLGLAQVPGASELPGASLVPLARDPQAPFPAIALSELDTRSHAMRTLRASGWKLFQNREKGNPCAVDLTHDPRERALVCDTSSPLLKQALLAAIEVDRALAPLALLHAGEAATATPPAEIGRELRDLGYTGGDDEPR